MEELNLQQFAASVAGLLSEGTKLSVKEDLAFVEVAGVKSIPQLGSDPERVDVTTLASNKRSYIAGLQDVDNLEFAIIYQGPNFKDIHELVKLGKEQDWTVKYPDGLSSTFRGEPDYKFDGAEVNAALGFNLVIVVSDGPDMNPAP